jgi:hypothetical protein
MVRESQFFNYYLASDIDIQCEVLYYENDCGKIIDEITATNPQNGMDIYEELDQVYERSNASINFISVRDAIYQQADSLLSGRL